jgi:tyrosine-protein phosphatase SIW14
MIVGVPIWYDGQHRKHFRNFRTVRPGVLYRSGQLSRDGLKRAIHEYGIRTVITLRAADEPDALPPDWEEEQFCRKEELYHYRLRPQCWWSPEGPVPASANVKKFLEVLDDPKHHPVLVHCFAGAHRTGAYCAIFRMEYDRWDNEEALQEVFTAGYDHLYQEEDVLGYLQTYRPRWRSQARSTAKALTR